MIKVDRILTIFNILRQSATEEKYFVKNQCKWSYQLSCTGV